MRYNDRQFSGNIKNTNIFKAQYISSRIHKNKSAPRHIAVKLQKIKDKAKFLKSKGESNQLLSKTATVRLTSK